MAPLSFLPFSLFFFHFVTVQSVIYRLKGQQVQFDPNITGQPEEIMWIYNKESIVEFNGFEDQVFGSYKGRVTLNWHSAQLQISDLRLEDSGKYDYEIKTYRKSFRQSYELEVIVTISCLHTEKVAKPTIICLMNSDSSSTVSAVLLCSVELNQTQSSVNFAWSSKGNDRYGPQLTIFLGGERDEKEYTCRVSNPRSNETATFRAKDCPSDARLSAGMIALIVLIPIVIVCVILLILLWRLIGRMTEDIVWEMMLAHLRSEHPPTETGSDQISIQNGGKRPKLEQPRPSSPLLGQQDTTEDPEREEREAKSHAETDLSNSPNVAPQDTHGEHNNDASADYKSDSSCPGKQDKSDNSPTRDIQD